MYAKFLIWSPKHGESVEDAHELTGYSPEDVAEKWASANFSRWEFPMEFEFMVTSNHDEPPTKVGVSVETIPHFSGYIMKDKT